MLFVPPVPEWDGLHPLIVHFPIALLLSAPLFVVLGLVFYRHRRAYFISALVLMALGSIASFVAVSTGEAGAQLVMRTPAISKVLEQHNDLAETTRTIFTVLTIIFAAMVVIPVVMKKEIRRLPLTLLHGVFLLLYLTGTIVLADTAHMGGLLVHEYGVQAMISTGYDPGAAVQGDADSNTTVANPNEEPAEAAAGM